MTKLSTILYSGIFALLLAVCFPHMVYGQLGADITTSENTNCYGEPCSYNGPSILINELMMSPDEFDGSLWGGSPAQRGEWIELYNPNICEPIDISCYYLGNNANDGGTYPGGYVIPPGTVVPPAGFALIRGVNAAAVPAQRLIENGGNVVELVVTGDGVCVGGGSRLWFPNSGGWFAFYDANGVPQDAVSWASQSNTGNYPCTPPLTGCGFTGTLPNYNEFPNDRKNKILDATADVFGGQSIRRLPDGGTWSGPGTPTYANCNAACISSDVISCNGTAVANPSGGTPPYSYLWNDPQSQTTQEADQLCAGQYCVLITDALGNTFQQCIDVVDVVYDIRLEVGICQGETYTLPDNSVVSVAGEYPVLLQTGKGCDSLITVDLEVFPVYDIELNPQICPSEVYTLPDGSEVSTTGTYDFAYQTVNGCDSLYTINLVVASPIQIPVNAQICEGNTYELPDGTIATNEGEYLILVAGPPTACDTLFTVNLTFYPDLQINFDELDHISCFGQQDGSVSLSVNGITGPYDFNWSDGVDHGADAEYLEAATYTVEVTDNVGCKADTVFEIIEPAPVSLSATADELICFGSESNLIANATGGTGDFEYQWSHTSSNVSISDVSPAEDTVYTVFAVDANGCGTDTITLPVTVINMFPYALEVAPDDSLCVGSSATLSASYSGIYEPYTYSWSNGLPDGAGPYTVSPDETTAYTVTVSDGCGNSVSKEIEVIVWSLPMVEIDTLINVSCFGESSGSAEIIVSGGNPGYTYNWSDGMTHGTQASNLEPGAYSVEITDSKGCKTDTLFDILEPAPVSLTATADELICFGAESNLIATAGGGTGDFLYNWSHTASNDAFINVSPEEDTSYTVFAIDENGCSTDTATLNVEVINMYVDSLYVSEVDSVCYGSSATLSASYSGQYPPYVYSWSHGLPNGVGPHTVLPDTTTTYTVTVTDNCGNSISKDIQIVIWAKPVATVNSLTNVTCFGEDDGSAEITMTEGTPQYTFIWSDGQNHGAIANGLIPGHYSIDIYDAHGCAVNTSFDISQPAPLELDLIGDSLICIGTEALLQATATGGFGSKTYHWSHTNEDSGNSMVSPQTDTQYTVFATDANGCVSEELTFSVSVISMDAGLLSVSGDTSICPAEYADLWGYYSGNYPPYTYNWTNGPDTGSGPHAVSPSETTTYELSVSDVCDNTLTANVVVDIYEAPVALLPDDLLAGCSPLEINLSDPFNVGSDFSHEWVVSDGESYSGNPVTFSLADPGIYEISLMVTSPDGCKAFSHVGIPVDVYALPDANFNASPWSTDILNPEIEFTDISSGSVFSIWTIESSTFENQSQISHTFSDTGRYAIQLYVENEFGCRDSITKSIAIGIDHSVEVPNAFTPSINGDNPYYDPNGTRNTVFYPFSEYVSEYHLSIFNRWGELIFESNEFEMGWNGTYRGEPCPQDVYVYKVEFMFTDGKKRTEVGDVTLFR